MTRIVALLAPLVLALAVMAEAAVAANSGPVGGGPPLTSGGPKTTVLHCKALGAGLTGVIVVNPDHEIGACRVAG